jgi:hypothetical protein
MQVENAKWKMLPSPSPEEHLPIVRVSRSWRSVLQTSGLRRAARESREHGLLVSGVTPWHQRGHVAPCAMVYKSNHRAEVGWAPTPCNCLGILTTSNPPSGTAPGSPIHASTRRLRSLYAGKCSSKDWRALQAGSWQQLTVAVGSHRAASLFPTSSPTHENHPRRDS